MTPTSDWLMTAVGPPDCPTTALPLMTSAMVRSFPCPPPSFWNRSAAQHLALDERRVPLPAHEPLVGQHFLAQRDGGLDRVDHELVQRPQGRGDGLVAAWGGARSACPPGCRRWTGSRSPGRRGVPSHAQARRGPRTPPPRPGQGRKSCAGSSALMRHSMAVPALGDRRAGEKFSVLAGGDAELPLHQVLPDDHLGDRVLHLDAGVDLQEVEVSRRRPA